MAPEFDAADFLALTSPEQIRTCRRLAEEALKLANTADKDLRATYAEIAHHWMLLADEIERLRR